MTYNTKTVLVVEDNPDDTSLLQHAARNAPPSISFHFVPDGAQAIAYLKGDGPFRDRQAHPLPELVLLDLWLPQIDGFEVLAWIRSHPELKSLKVFVWTDSAFQDIIERARRAGADSFVPKSVAFVRGGLDGLIASILQTILRAPKDGGKPGQQVAGASQATNQVAPSVPGIAARNRELVAE
jgi:CheY-like chemotaxis protein